MTHSLFIGLMSGTSLDGVDASLMDLSASPRMCSHLTRGFPGPLRDALVSLASSACLRPEAIAEAESALCRAYADAVDELLAMAGTGHDRVTAIGCHGQTIRHLPERHFSWQIGHPARLAVATGLPVVADFRAADMARGGQGAPLAPVFHQAFFGHEREKRLVVNLGGIANVSLLEPARPPRGWDTGPANTLLDAWYQAHHERGLWDEGGQWAASGEVDKSLLERLLEHDYFQRPAPKSTGPELFNSQWLREQAGDRLRTLSPADIQATLTALSCHPIAEAARAFSAERIILCGGGAQNRTFLRCLDELSGGIPVETSRHHGIDPGQVESAGFAWLARQRWEHRAIPLSDVTGATANGTAGAIWLP